LIVLSFTFFFSSRRRHTRSKRDWSSDVCSSDLFLIRWEKITWLGVGLFRTSYRGVRMASTRIYRVCLYDRIGRHLGCDWYCFRHHFCVAFLARQFMNEAETYDVLTLPDYLAVKFGDKANVILWTASILIASFFMFYVAAQLAGAGKLFFTTFHMNETIGIALATFVVLAIAFFGGFVSVVWTDMIQSIMMLVTLVVLPVIAFIYLYT